MKKIATLLTVVLTISSCSTSTSKEPYGFIEIKGKRQRFLDKGVGDPPIIFITGSGSWLEHFDSVQTVIAQSNRTISYDKPGIGKSEMIEEPRTIENMTDHLRQILDETKIHQPVILVGHSLGGFVARYFEIKYPSRVAGMVLIDPADEYLTEEVGKVKSKDWGDYLDSIQSVMVNDTTSSIGQREELKYGQNVDSVMRTVKTTTRIPVTLIESNRIIEEDLMTEDVIEMKKKLYRRLQIEQLPQMKIVSTNKSGHFIQLDEPNLIIDAIKEMIRELGEMQ